MMHELRLQYPVPLMKRMMSVSASGYYAWLGRPLSKRAWEEMRFELEIKAADKRTRQTYGPERLQHDLAEHGIRVGICRIRRIRKNSASVVNRSGNSVVGQFECRKIFILNSTGGVVEE